jgi:hypothetical protein
MTACTTQSYNAIVVNLFNGMGSVTTFFSILKKTLYPATTLAL